MLRLPALLLFVCLSPLAVAAPPPALLDQVQRLGVLLGDGYAEWYREATDVQTLKLDADRMLELVLFTLEGFGGGNSHVQYLAAFQPGEDSSGQPYHTLVDVIAIGGKGWRAIDRLAARAARGRSPGEIVLTLPAKFVGPDDAPNFPGRAGSVRLALRDGRFSELTAR